MTDRTNGSKIILETTLEIGIKINFTNNNNNNSDIKYYVSIKYKNAIFCVLLEKDKIIVPLLELI